MSRLHVSERALSRINQIIKDQALAAGTTVADVRWGSHRRPAVLARHRAIFQAAEEFPKFSSVQFGKIFNVHHSSVLYALGKVKPRCSPILIREPDLRRTA